MYVCTWNCFLFLRWRRDLGKEQYSETTSTMPMASLRENETTTQDEEEALLI